MTELEQLEKRVLETKAAAEAAAEAATEAEAKARAAAVAATKAEAKAKAASWAEASAVAWDRVETNDRVERIKAAYAADVKAAKALKNTRDQMR